MESKKKISLLVIIILTFLFNYANAQSSIGKLLSFYGQREAQIRDYEGNDYEFIASIGSYFGNTYAFSIETEEALDGLVVSMPLYKEDNEILLYHDAPNNNTISRMETGLSKNQANIFIEEDVRGLNLKKIANESNKISKDKRIWSNEKFVFVLISLYDGMSDYILEIYPLKDLEFVMNEFAISEPNKTK